MFNFEMEGVVLKENRVEIVLPIIPLMCATLSTFNNREKVK